MQQLRAAARNRAAARPLAVEAGNGEATVWIYDFIGFDPWSGTGISAEAFAKEIAAITAPTIRVRMNSPGGSVFDGRAIHAALKAHKSKIVVSIEGVAASAATFIAMAADRVEMAGGSLFMIHNAWTIAAGNADDFLQAAALLEKIDGTMVADYVAKTGATDEQVRSWMNAETWFTAEEAKAAGFIDSITATEANASAWDLSGYEKAPPVAEAAPKSTEQEDGAAAWADAHRRLQLSERISA